MDKIVSASLALEIEKAGSVAAWAVSKSISPSYVHEVVRGSREPGKKILDALGLERVTTYRKAKKCPEETPAI